MVSIAILLSFGEQQSDSFEGTAQEHSESFPAAVSARSHLAWLEPALTFADRTLPVSSNAPQMVQVASSMPVGLPRPGDFEGGILLTDIDVDTERLCPRNPDSCDFFAAAMEVALEIPENYYRMDTLGHVAAMQAAVGMETTSRRVFTELWNLAGAYSDRFERLMAHVALGTRLSSAGLFDEAQAAADEIDEGLLRANVLALVAKGLAEAGHREEAVSTFSEAVLLAVYSDRPPIMRFDALFEIAVAQGDVGYMKRARATLAAMTNDDWVAGLNLDDSSSYFRPEMLARIAHVEATVGLTDQARETFAEALTAADEVERRAARQTALVVIAIGQAGAGFYDDALALLPRIDDEDLHSPVLSMIARSQANADLIDDALATVDRILDDLDRAAALWQIANAQGRADLPDEALLTFALATALSGDGHADFLTQTAEALAAIAHAQAVAGRVARARGMFSRAVDAADLILNETERSDIMAILARAQADTAVALWQGE